MSKPPCFQCESRTATCHATCEKYLVFLETVKLIRKKKDEQRLVDEFITASTDRWKRYINLRK